MFESEGVRGPEPVAAAPAAPSACELLERVREAAEMLGAAGVAGLPVAAVAGDDAGACLVDLLTELSRLSSAVEAASARAATELDRVRRAQEAAAGVPAARRGRGVAAEVGLARRESGARGRSFLGFGKVLCTEMPHTMRRLAAGDLSPWRAVLLVKESACLSLEDRIRLDEDLCADPAALAGLGDRAVAAAAKAWACREDPASVVERRRHAENERRVSLRPAPDTMAYLTALVPVTEGVAMLAALTKHADSTRARGDSRSRGQVMADALVARVTGQAEGASPGILVNLVMTDHTLFHSGDSEPANLPGYGPVPASVARDIVQRAGKDASAWVRRLYVAPSTGALVSMDSQRRKVPPGLAELVRLRDNDSCRVLWCDAPAKHVDHVRGVVDGGQTQSMNLEGACELHNYGKQAPGWRAEPVVSSRDPADSRDPTETEPHVVMMRTPSGHRYLSSAPPLTGPPTLRSDREPEPCMEHERAGPRADYSDGERTLVAWWGSAA